MLLTFGKLAVDSEKPLLVVRAGDGWVCRACFLSCSLAFLRFLLTFYLERKETCCTSVYM